MTSTSQTQTKEMKQIISDEIKDIFVLDYNFDVAYNIIDDTSGNSYGGGDTVNISDVKYCPTDVDCTCSPHHGLKMSYLKDRTIYWFNSILFCL